jgi:FecR protein
MDPNPKHSTVRPDRIEWFTVRYRSLLLGGGGLLALLAVGGAVWLLVGRQPPPPALPETLETGARFMSIEGSVLVKPAGTLEWKGATLAMVLRQNDLVQTRGGATAGIRFADGTVFNVRPDTLMTIEESSQNLVSRQQRVSLSIQSGEANFETAARTVPGETTIRTPTVRATADRETKGNIQVADSGETGLRIFSGTGRAQTTAGQNIRLASNEGLHVNASGTAGEKTSLPQVPELTAPPNNTEVAYPDPSRAITLLMWNGVPSAETYRVMVDFSASFARPLVDRQGYRKTQMELRSLDTGTYYWKVAAINGNGEEGAFAGPSRFSLLKSPPSAASPPPLLVETLERRGNILHVRGRTAPGATLTLDGVRIEVQPDGTFNEFVTVESDAPTVLVRSTGIDGAVALQRRPVVVTN